MVKAGESINEKEDSYKVIERLLFLLLQLALPAHWYAFHFHFAFRYQSGFTPPTDIPFEDLSKQDPESSQESHYNNVQSSHLTVKGTISANRIKKRVGIFNIFGSNKVRIISYKHFTNAIYGIYILWGERGGAVESIKVNLNLVGRGS